MERLSMCRICSVKNVRMYVLVNKNLHELYEKLTDIPFVTEDRRPVLACFVCCSQLKKFYRLLKKCLKAEELFAQILNEEYELKPLIKQNNLEFVHGFIKTPIESISIVEVQTESVVVKQELQDVFEELNDILVPKEEYPSDDDLHENYQKIQYMSPPQPKSQLKDDVPLMELKTEVEEEQEVHKNELKPKKTNNLQNNCLEIEYMPPHQSESLSEDDVPLMEIKTEVEEEKVVHENKAKKKKTKRPTVAEEPILHLRRSKLDDSIPTGLKANQISVSEIIRTTQIGPAKLITKSKKPKNNPHECGICHCKFTKKSDYVRHLRTHTGEKPYKCETCLSSFSQKAHLTDHMRTHTGVKPYKCDICPSSFSKKAHLRDHVRTHTGEKPFKCDKCPSSFVQKTNLTRHSYTHR